jgi:hypothetical protein
MAALGVAASVASSYGQGLVNFTTYAANNNSGVSVFNFGTSAAIPDGYHFDIYYALGTSVTDPVNNLDSSSVAAAPSGLTDYLLAGVTSSGGNSTPDPTGLSIPGYASGSVTFEVVAFNGSSYAASTIRGRSGSWVQQSLTTAAAAAGGSPVPNVGDNTLGAGTFPNFYVASVPEPTTLALAGLGGLASLVAMRRKQA